MCLSCFQRGQDSLAPTGNSPVPKREGPRKEYANLDLLVPPAVEHVNLPKRNFLMLEISAFLAFSGLQDGGEKRSIECKKDPISRNQFRWAHVSSGAFPLEAAQSHSLKSLVVKKEGIQDRAGGNEHIWEEERDMIPMSGSIKAGLARGQE